MKSLCQQALSNLLAAKMRTLLAMLGILVGTAAVVALLSSGKLATDKALAEFKQLGTDLLAVASFKKTNSSNQGEKGIRLTTWRQLPQWVPGIVEVAAYSNLSQTLSFQAQPIEAAIVAADESLQSILKTELQSGYFVSHLSHFDHYCVIGSGLAEKLHTMHYGDLLGQQLKIGSNLFTIIGILKPWEQNAFFANDLNQALIIPLGSMALVNPEAGIDNAIIRIHPNAALDPLMSLLQERLSQTNPNQSIFLHSAKQIITSMEKQGRIFTLLLGLIGAISLLVGGIGIMNVMLVSVNERKKEIGIRKAVGARNKDIQRLFLVESLFLSLIGGCIGILLGLALTALIALLNQWPWQWYWLPPLAGFSVSVACGIFFGYYPASRAAKLDPIQSLREG